MMKKKIIAPALASILAAGAAGLALAPSGVAAQEGTTFLLVPQGGGQPGQEYVLVLTPRAMAQTGQQGQGAGGQATGQYGQGFSQGMPLDTDRYARELYERGYWQGRFEEQMRQRQAMQAPGGETGIVDLPPRYQEPGLTVFNRPGEFDVFAQPQRRLDPEIQQALREARQALGQGDMQRAEQALARIDQMLGEGERQRLQQALDDAEQALRRNDQQGAEEALRQARQVVQGQAQAGSTPPPSDQRPQAAEQQGQQQRQGQQQ